MHRGAGEGGAYEVPGLPEGRPDEAAAQRVLARRLGNEGAGAAEHGQPDGPEWGGEDDVDDGVGGGGEVGELRHWRIPQLLAHNLAPKPNA